MLFNRTNSYIFARCAIKRYLISLKYSKIYITYIYILLSGVEEDSEAYSETLTTKMEYFCVPS